MYINNEKVKVPKCGKNCVCCPYIKEGTKFKFKYRDIPFKVISPFNCNTSNLLYVITCPGCNEEYIGQTGRTLRERVVLYRQHIRTKEYQMSLVEEHLRTCGNSKFQIFPFFNPIKAGLFRALHGWGGGSSAPPPLLLIGKSLDHETWHTYRETYSVQIFEIFFLPMSAFFL